MYWASVLIAALAVKTLLAVLIHTCPPKAFLVIHSQILFITTNSATDFPMLLLTLLTLCCDTFALKSVFTIVLGGAESYLVLPTTLVHPLAGGIVL